jgi:CheY-like chemotaxis protein
LLRWWGYDVRVAYDGVTGMELARNYQPDYLLSDIGLPRMDGYLLAQRLRSQPSLNQTRLIAVTAYGDRHHLQRAKEAGFDDCLIKPVNPLDLERLLRETVEERKAKWAGSFSI